MSNYDVSVEVNLDNIAENTKVLLNNYPEYKYYIGVVKGYGYGHGLYVAKTMIENGINYLAISTIDEAIKLREYEIKTPILCLEPINLKHIDEIVKYDITLTVASLEYAKELALLKKEVKVHFKLDCLMQRLGFNDINKLKEAIGCLKNIVEIEGLYSHMASVGFYDDSYDKQIAKFNEFIEQLDLNKFKIIHLDRSLTMMTHPKHEKANGVRAGIFLYGYNQMPIFPTGFRKKIGEIKRKINKVNFSPVIRSVNYQLKPAYRLKAKILQINTIKANSKVGYGGSFIPQSDMKIAIVAIGYADGLMLNKHFEVIINNRPYKLVGNIDMKMCTVVIDDNVSIDDEVYIINNNAQTLGRQMGVTTYKVLCNTSLQIPRIYYSNDEIEYVEEKNI